MGFATVKITEDTLKTGYQWTLSSLTQGKAGCPKYVAVQPAGRLASAALLRHKSGSKCVIMRPDVHRVVILHGNWRFQ